MFNFSILVSSLVSGGKKTECSLPSVASQFHQNLYPSHSFITLQLSISIHLHGFKFWEEKPALFQTIFSTSDFQWLCLKETTQ